MKSVTVQFQENSNVATITVKNKTTQEIKKTDIPTVLNLISTLTSNEKDTGYLNSSLIREAVRKVSSRAFYLKTFITPVMYRLREKDGFINPSNPFGIKEESGRLVFPDFIFRDIIGFISNSNTDKFNPSYYKIYNAVPDMLGSISDHTTLIPLFPNQFGNRICWPDSFDQGILAKRDPQVQSSFVTKYLTSIFNSDLLERYFDKKAFEPHEKEFNTFLNEVFNKDHKTDYKSLYDNYPGLFLFFAYYFLSNIKELTPANFTRKDYHVKLGSLFTQYK